MSNNSEHLKLIFVRLSLNFGFLKGLDYNKR